MINQDMTPGLQPIKESLRVGMLDGNQPSHKNIMNDPWVGGGGLTIEVGVVGGGGGVKVVVVVSTKEG